jgi:hypothetical protein
VIQERDVVSRALDTLVEPLEGAPEPWQRIVEDARSGGPRRRRMISERARERLATTPSTQPRTVGIAAVAGMLAIAAFATLSLMPADSSRCSAGVLECAAAAVAGEGPVVHLNYWHDGEDPARPIDIWYDLERDLEYSRLFSGAKASEAWVGPLGIYVRTADGEIRQVATTPPGPGEYPSRPVVRSLGSYREMLRNGTATLHGVSTFNGRPVYLIDLPASEPVNPVTKKRDRVVQRIAVDRDSYKPVGWALAFGDRELPFNGGSPWFVIDSASFEARDPGMFVVPNRRRGNR